jgi:thymidylate synthase
MFALIMLQQRIADKLNIEVGSYTHRANSFHCYEKDLQMLEKYFNSIIKNSDNTYDYKDDWEDIMNECNYSIVKKVEKLKNRN